MPADPLPAQRAERDRDLRPGVRVRGVDDPGARPLRAQLMVQAHHQLHVLTERLARQPAGVADQVTPEDTEGAGDDRQAVDRRPGDPRAEKAAQVLGGLACFRATAGDMRDGDRVLLDQRPVRDPNGAADRHDIVRVGGEHLDDPFQRVPFEQGVRVDDRDQFQMGDVQAGVDRIRPAAVLLLQNPQPRLAAADVVAQDRLRSGSSSGRRRAIRPGRRRRRASRSFRPPIRRRRSRPRAGRNRRRAAPARSLRSPAPCCRRARSG